MPSVIISCSFPLELGPVTRAARNYRLREKMLVRLPLWHRCMRHSQYPLRGLPPLGCIPGRPLGGVQEANWAGLVGWLVGNRETLRKRRDLTLAGMCSGLSLGQCDWTFG